MHFLGKTNYIRQSGQSTLVTLLVIAMFIGYLKMLMLLWGPVVVDYQIKSMLEKMATESTSNWSGEEIKNRLARRLMINGITEVTAEDFYYEENRKKKTRALGVKKEFKVNVVDDRLYFVYDIDQVVLLDYSIR